MKLDLMIIGGGLAGSEAAWQAAKRGLRVGLYEMRPGAETGAHQTGYLAELVCSNSLGSNMADRASGLLKNELRKMGSLLIELADGNAVPAGSALAVDRVGFAAAVTDALEKHPNIEIIREEVTQLPADLTIIATGPLTSSAMSDEITALTGQQYLFFYDAISPIVNYDSINMEVAFRASRYNRGDDEEGDYINCPMTEDEYTVFLEALQNAERIELHSFEKDLETKGVKTGLHHFLRAVYLWRSLPSGARNPWLMAPCGP